MNQERKVPTEFEATAIHLEQRMKFACGFALTMKSINDAMEQGVQIGVDQLYMITQISRYVDEILLGSKPGKN